jgi:hypothetical protein
MISHRKTRSVHRRRLSGVSKAASQCRGPKLKRPNIEQLPPSAANVDGIFLVYGMSGFAQRKINMGSNIVACLRA